MNPVTIKKLQSALPGEDKIKLAKMGMLFLNPEERRGDRLLFSS